jgi:ABC-type tungstate transport system permease subunit
MGLRISIDEKLLSEDLTVKRYPVPNGDFVLIGRKSDPADVIGEDIVTRHSDRSRPSRCRSFCGRRLQDEFCP